MRPMYIFDVCTHPKGIIPTCRCGANASCPDCGYGRGAHPCDCSRVDAAVTKYKDMFAEAWERLAQ